MAQKHGRLDPEEVKRAMAAEAGATEPEAPFNSPFAAARAQLEKLAVRERAPTAAERRAARAGEKREEPSELARVRAAHRAARQALTDAVKPVRRRPPGGGDGGDGDRGGGGGGGGWGGDGGGGGQGG